VRRLLLFTAAIAPACGTTEPAVSHQRVMIEPKRPDSAPTKPPEWFDEEIAAAADDLRAGRLEEGLARVFAAKAESPSPEDALALDDLLRRLNQAVLDLPTLVATVEPERDPIVFGEPVRITIRLTNPGTRTVRVPVRAPRARVPLAPMGPRPAPKASKALFILDVVRTEYNVDAQVVSSRRQMHYPLRRDLDLPPGATTEITFNLEGAANDRPLDGFRTYAVGGQLRAAVIEVGGLRRYEALKLKPGILRSFRPNYEHLAEDPTHRVRQALERNAPVHLLTAAALVPPQERAEAVDTLVDALKGGGPMDLAAFAALSYLTNIRLGNDAGAWRAWWSRVRETYFDTPLAEEPEPGEGPRFSR